MPSMELEQFYGRQETLRLLEKRVRDLKEGYRQNIAFLGDRFVGKSIILHKFIAEMDEDGIVTVYLNLENKDFNYFYHKFVGSLLYQFSIQKKLPLFEDIRALVESVQDELPQTVRIVKRIQHFIIQGKVHDAYREIVALPLIFSKEAGVFCLLIFDEFHRLEDFGFPEVFQELGKNIMTQKRCLYLVTSSLPAVAKKILSEKLSLLFGNFEIIDIESFDLKTSQEFVEFHLEGLRINSQLQNFLIDFTGSHPLYLRLICQELVRLSIIHRQSDIYAPMLGQAIENVLFNPWGNLHAHFSAAVSHATSGRQNLFMSDILIALTRKSRIQDLAGIIGIKQSLVKQKVNRFMECGLVDKNGHFYYLKDKLFRYWVRFVYQKSQRCLDWNPQREQREFASELAQSIDSFCASSKKDVPSRIAELLYSFEAEAYQINGRRYKLPLFQEIVPTKIRRSKGVYFDAMKATTSEGQWFIVIKADEVTENDITAITKEVKRLEQKPQRCVLIAFSELDENARVKALQERMWIWNEGELNSLLNLYEKPYIVR